jgi:hypothetical protein
VAVTVDSPIVTVAQLTTTVVPYAIFSNDGLTVPYSGSFTAVVTA